MRLMELTDLQGPGPGLFYHLTDAQLRSKQEPEKGIFIAEGPKVVLSALQAGYEPVSVLIRRKMIDGPGAEILRRCGDVPVYTAADEVLSALTGFKLQRSWVLCAMRRPRPLTAEEALRGVRRTAVLEGITEPSNVGAIFRSAAALGAGAVLLSPTCCDPLHRRSVRVCMGSVFQVPWARLGPDEAFPLLKRLDFATVGLALMKDCLTIDDPRLAAAERLAIFLGTEDTGLAEETIRQCDHIAKIPMAAGIDSLNVAAAAAIAFWQLRSGDTAAPESSI
ncbi:MAG: RNA methyltransferase [Clostridia bacterium]|nr:RNA methyltransferase [Clostridia bacterium]